MSAPSSDFRDMVVKRRDACVKYQDDKPSRDRREALRFYRGDNLDDYGDSGDGLSTVVSRDTMEWDPLESTCRHASLSIL